MDIIQPQYRKPLLDGELLKKHGLVKEKIEQCDALFFFFLILPQCDIEKGDSGVEGDTRKPFYSEARKFTNKYAIVDKQLDGKRVHPFKPCTTQELVNFDGIVFQKRASNVHNSWCEDSKHYDPGIANSMYHYRFLQLRRNVKLNDNDKEIKRG